MNKFISCRKYVVLFFGFLLHLAYGSVLTFGNMTTYITSYQRNVLKLDVSYADTLWIQAVSFTATGIALPLGGFLEKFWGPRWTIMLAALFMSGVFLTYFTVNHSLSMLVLTYGFLFGIGARLGYMSPIAAALRWFPDHQHGMVNGVIIAGYSFGAFIFNLVQIAYVNPQNIPAADMTGYFDDVTVLERVPGLFILLGSVNLAIQLLAVIFITNPPEALTRPETTVRLFISAEPTIPLLQILRSPLFYALWFTFLFNDQAIIAITGLYKAFGLQFWNNDKTLTLIGSLSSISNAACRLVWGLLADRMEYRMLMLTLTALVAALLLSINATPWAGVWLYGCWVFLINAITPGTYILLPKAVGDYFGRENITFNYGLLFTSFLVGGPLSALVSVIFLDTFGWIGVFWSTAAFSAAAGVVTWFLPSL